MRYNEVTTSGTIWKRCKGISINIPLSGPSEYTFSEENILELANNTIHIQAGICINVSQDDMIEIIDPKSMQSTGATISKQELNNILFSLYIQTARLRDTGVLQ